MEDNKNPEVQPFIRDEHDFWREATSLAKTLLPTDVEKRFNNHCDSHNYNWNEKLFFRKMLADALEFQFTMAMLRDRSNKAKVKQDAEDAECQSNVETHESKETT